MLQQRLLSTCYTRNPAAKPLRRPKSMHGFGEVEAWYTVVRVNVADLSPFAAWLAAHVSSTLSGGNKVYLVLWQPSASRLRLESSGEDHIANVRAPQHYEQVHATWKFSTYDPSQMRPTSYWEREARRILVQAPLRVEVITCAGEKLAWEHQAKGLDAH